MLVDTRWRGQALFLLFLALLLLGSAHVSGANRGWSGRFGDRMLTTPVCDDGIYALIADGDEVFLSRIDPDGGTQEWRVSLPGNTAPVGPAARDRHIVAASGGQVIGLDPSDGRILWNLSLEPACTPALRDDLLLISNSSVLWAFNASERPRPLWNVTLDRTPWFIVVEHDLVLVGDGPTRLTARDPLNGTEIWVFDAQGALAGPPLATDGGLIVVSSDGTSGKVSVLGLEGRVGRVIDLPPTRCPPLRCNGTLLADDNGTVRFLDPGWEEVWRVEFGRPVIRLVADGDRVYALDGNGTVTALDVVGSPPRMIWQADIGADGIVRAGDGSILLSTPDARLIYIDDVPIQGPRLEPDKFVLSSNPPLAGQEIEIFALVGNHGSNVSRVEVIFSADGRTIGRRWITLMPGQTTVVSTFWRPSGGTHEVRVALGIRGERITCGATLLTREVTVVGTARGNDVQGIILLAAGMFILWGMIIAIAVTLSKGVFFRKGRARASNAGGDLLGPYRRCEGRTDGKNGEGDGL